MKRIVVAEDNHEILKLVESTLRFRGYDVTTARNGQEAWEIIARNPPDAAILDMNMPGVDGLEVCRRIRSDPSTQHVGVIFLTAYEQLENKVAAFNAGADDYVVKPFVPGELALRIDAVIKRGEMARAAAPAAPQTLAARPEVIAVLGCKGGVGASVLSANVAVLLATFGARAALVDLDLDHSLANMLLDIAPGPRQRTIADLSASYASELDWDMLASFLLPHSSGLKLLPGPISPTQAELVTGEHVKGYVNVLREQFDFVVIDLATGFRDANLDVFDLCDRLLLVVTPDVLSLKVYRSMLQVLEQLHVPRNRLHVVVNQTTPFSRVSVADVKKVVELPVIASIPFGGEQFTESVNNGTPIVQKFPTNPASQAIRDLAMVFRPQPAVAAGARR